MIAAALQNNPVPTADDLDARLAALLAEWAARPFVWGQTDCCQFARAAAWRLHGLVIDSPAYINERHALRVFREMGGFPGLLKSAGLRPRRHTMAARRGDFAIVRQPFDNPGRPGLWPQGIALVTGLQAHQPGALGLVAVPRVAWLDVWGGA